MAIRRYCKCGCGNITNPGRKWLHGHTWKNRKQPDSLIEKRVLSHSKTIKIRGKKIYIKRRCKCGCGHYPRKRGSKWMHGHNKGNLGCYKSNSSPSLYRSMKLKKCEICGSKKNLHAHHKDLDRTNNHLSNIQTLCFICHGGYHSMLYWYNKESATNWLNGRINEQI